jgi:hypothetical protein
MTPAATPGCVLATPTTPLTIPSGGSQAFTWTCSSTTPGAFALGATVDATPALAAAPSPIPLAVQSPAVIPPASLHAGAATLNVAQAMTVSVQLANTGQADATVSALALSATGTGAVTCGASPTPAPPQTIAGGTSVTFSWTCTGSTAGPVTLSATAAISDANTGVDVSPAISSVSVAVQTPASLTATLGATVGGLPLSSPVTVGTAVTLTLSLHDPAGHATARVNTVTATKTGNVTCSTPAPVPQDVPGGDTPGIVTWTCTPNNKSNANGFSLGATVTAIDLNTGNPVPAPAVPPISLIVN